MPICRFLPEAAADLEAIGDYIAADNPGRAVTFVGELEGTCRRIADMPRMGVARDELRPGLRMFPVQKYLIFYQLADDGIEIVRLLRASREVKQVLGIPNDL